MSPLAGFAIVALFVFLGIGGIFALAAGAGSNNEPKPKKEKPYSAALEAGLQLAAKNVASPKEQQQFFKENNQYFK